MKPGKSKSKGNSFENLVSRKLSLWLTNDKSKTQLIPSRLSGGWKDGAARHAGDLAANGPGGERFRKHFVVECKHHKKDLLWGLYLPPGKDNIPGWWQKLCGEAAEHELCPILVCRQNARTILVGLPTVVVENVYDREDRPEVLIQYWQDPLGQDIPGCSLIRWDTFIERKPKLLLTFVRNNF